MDKPCNYVYVLKQVKPELSPEKEAIVEEHFEYLKKALAERILGIAGRRLDGAF